MPKIVDAYDTADELKNRLLVNRTVTQVTKEFQMITDNSERIKYLHKLLEEENLFPKYSILKEKKSNDLANRYRNQGNEYYKARNNYDALIYYNKSLCFADKETIGTAYFNRSAVYLEMEKYDLSLQNIQLARKNGYPEHEKLKKREAICMENINNKLATENRLNISSFLKLTYEPSRIPGVSGCLELAENDKFGRHIVTNRDLKVGDIVAMEEPFSKILLPSSKFERCANCLELKNMNLIPCAGCTSTMFCFSCSDSTSECAEKAYQKFHKFECNVIDAIQIIFTKIIQISLRTFFEALDVFDGNADELNNFLKEIDGVPRNAYDIEENPDEKAQRKNWLHQTDALVTNENYRNTADHFQRSGICAILTDFVKKESVLEGVLTTESHWVMFRKFIYKQSQISKLNYHGIFTMPARKIPRPDVCEQENFGSGSFLFASLINHSCAPNVVRLSLNLKMCVVINRPIAKGGQLFDNYGYHHCLENRKNRQTELNDQYRFKCQCEACTNDYPLYQDLVTFDNRFHKFLGDDIDQLMQYNYIRAKKKWKLYCDYIDKNDKEYPSYEICALQECILRCLRIFSSDEKI